MDKKEQNENVIEIKNLVWGLNPIMGAYSFINDKKIKFWNVQVITEDELLMEFPELKEYKYKMPDIQSGTVLFSDERKGLYIKANEGSIKVIEIQGENAKRMSINDFLRGNRIDAGTVFE